MLFKSWKPNFTEVHEYTLDLQRITMLRDKCTVPEEKEQYNTILKVMLEVLEFLNTAPRKR